MIENIAVIFGGRSCEHEISILSAIQVMSCLLERYHVIPIYISKDSEMYSGNEFLELESYQDMNLLLKQKRRVSMQRVKQEVYFKNRWGQKKRIDFVFPIMHGTNGEDGSIQGFLEILHVAYAGSNVLASSIAQSKVVSKMLLKYHQLNTLDYAVVTSSKQEIPFLPCIIKPSNLGSSIGIQIVLNKEGWEQKVEEALLYDECCLVEPYIEDFKEINISVKNTMKGIELSHLEEVQKKEAILSFEDKYEWNTKLNVDSQRIMDPILSVDLENKIKELAQKVYSIFNFEGIIRIDFMIIKNEVYINEVNTIPGSYAFYLWKEKKMMQLLEEVMQRSLRIYQNKDTMITSFNSNVLFHFEGVKRE